MGSLCSTEIGHRILRSALGNFVTGVSIVTAVNEKGELCGLTANSFTSVSLNPPLILVCVSHSARSYKAIIRNGRFAVQILCATTRPRSLKPSPRWARLGAASVPGTLMTAATLDWTHISQSLSAGCTKSIAAATTRSSSDRSKD